MSASIGADRPLSAAAYIPVRAGAVCHPPSGVALLSLVTIAHRTHTSRPPSGTGRQGRAGALSTRAIVTSRLAFRARLTTFGHFSVASICPAPLRGAVTRISSSFFTLLSIFPGLP